VRVLQIARYGAVRGGAETYVHALSDGLRAAGHDVALAFGAEPGENAHGFHIPAILDGAASPSAEGGRALEAAIASFRPDVVHAHVAETPWIAPFCAARAPSLLAVHDHKLDSPAGTKYWAAWHKQCTIKPGAWCLLYNVAAHCGSLRANATLRPYRAWRRSNRAARGLRLQVFSSYMRDAVARAGIDPANVGMTHYPVPPLAAPLPPGDADKRPVVFASGRLNKEKGFHQLLDAIARVRTPAHLVIAGAGHERGALEARARRIVAPHRITFTGWLGANELAGWVERASVVAFPSMWPEPFGIAGIEAMARAKPVVGFDAGGVREWLADGETGTLVKHGDVIAFARALEALLNDDETRARMGTAARARAETEFALDRHVARMLDLYREISA
jgi:glycosyltransferase involved in cell wall biosynthesis